VCGDGSEAEEGEELSGAHEQAEIEGEAGWRRRWEETGVRVAEGAAGLCRRGRKLGPPVGALVREERNAVRRHTGLGNDH
jgi:hypothetical protein